MRKVPRATYRIQLNAQFGFDEVAALSDYLRALGVSHLYASPYLRAASGSQHGYDVVDHSCVNPELGGAPGHARMCDALREHGLGQVLDIVPNHMAIGSPDNRWWWDVLENGPASHYAAYFDVDWDVTEDNRISLPILGEHYADALESRLVRVERAAQRFVVRYYDRVLPVAPASLAGPLRAAARSAEPDSGSIPPPNGDNGGPTSDPRSQLAFFADALALLAVPALTDHETLSRRRRDIQVIFEYLGRLLEEQPELAQAVDGELAALSADVGTLDAFLERQNWRLAHWKNAATDLGYRRFFDVNSLVGLRVEDTRVFASTHRLVLRWLGDGTLDGVRVDHPDGLLDPEEYMGRLRNAAPSAWIVVEKILEADEQLPDTWGVAGTTGYDFMRLLDHVFLDPEGEAALGAFAERFAGAVQHWTEMAYEAKQQIVHDVLASESHRLANLVHRLLVGQLTLRDCSWREVTTAVTELIANYASYRSYVRIGTELTPRDATLIAGAVAAAAARQPEVEPRIWSALESALTLRINSGLASEFALRTQQVTGAVAAKSIEDTLYYRYVRLIALNEVGGCPSRFGLPVAAFHRELEARSAQQPEAMLSSATHDTKRGEDLRARLLVLSEIPAEWGEAVERWSARAERYRGGLVDGLTEYFFYQTLVGAYPLPLERALSYMQKVIREAKLRTSWQRPQKAYETAVANFVGGILADRELMADIAAFVERIARAGYVNSLGRTLIKLTAPGVPDLYQGDELWDFNLVDPDNRRPVDFALRRELLARLPKLTPEQALCELERGTPKMLVTWATLQLRQNRPALFEAPYRPVALEGPDAERGLCYCRGDDLCVVVPRWQMRGALAQKPTLVRLPEGDFRNTLTGERLSVGRTGVELRSLWQRFPVALLERSV